MHQFKTNGLIVFLNMLKKLGVTELTLIKFYQKLTILIFKKKQRKERFGRPKKTNERLSRKIIRLVSSQKKITPDKYNNKLKVWSQRKKYIVA